MVAIPTFTQMSPEQGARILQEGGLVAFPTETVYGLGADAFNPRAVVRIFEVKGRPLFDPLIVHISRIDEMERIAYADMPLALKLADAFWPGPLTLVIPKRDIIPDIVTAGLPTVAIRMPAHPVALQLIQLAQRPIAAPSANLFGRISPTTARHVYNQLGDRIDGILEGGPCRIGIESTIVSLSDPTQPEILRAGGVSVEEIEKVIGPVRVPDRKTGPVQAPGMLLHHYAPRTPVRIQSHNSEFRCQQDGLRIGLVAFRSPSNTSWYQVVEVLSKKGDLQEAAANLFAALHRLDAAGLDLIVAEPLPKTGLGLAIMDRLERASA